MNLEELKKKPAWRAKFNITDEMVGLIGVFLIPYPLFLKVLPFETVPIINIPEFGNVSAAYACEHLKIKSPNDKKLLEEAKDLVYLNGFAKGVMLVGEHKDT
jgi:leucyl-tRNA synthetase